MSISLLIETPQVLGSEPTNHGTGPLLCTTFKALFFFLGFQSATVRVFSGQNDFKRAPSSNIHSKTGLFAIQKVLDEHNKKI
jgi:hypothetical protein